MMKNRDMVNALNGLAKKGLIENYQERELIRSAATRITCLAAEVRDLRRKLDEITQVAIALEDYEK